MDRRELEVISAVCMTDSPYVVRVYNWWYEMDVKYDKYCILMELCEENLANFIKKRYVEEKSHFTEREVWEIICNIMEGIQKCHDLNFTHRDLKPHNSNFPLENEADYSTIFCENKNLENNGLWHRSQTPSIGGYNTNPLATIDTNRHVYHRNTTSRIQHLIHKTRVTRLRGPRTPLLRHLLSQG